MTKLTTLANQIYSELNPPMTKEKLQKAYELGMIKKDDLMDGYSYIGTCRNAEVAVWNEAKGLFTYQRTKFGSTFPENIEHPEDDKGYDVFIPVAILYKGNKIEGEE